MKKNAMLIGVLVLCVAAAAIYVSSSSSKTESSSSTSSAVSSTAGSGEPAATSSANYPSGNLNGIVPWGAGGGTDSLMRPLAALAEQKLNTSIVIQNMPGAGGTIGTQYVYDAKADGSYLLMAAENAAIFDTLGISELTYEDFDCVFLIGGETVGVMVSKNSKFTSFTEIINAALSAPSTVKMATAGIGSMPWQGSAFITSVTGAQFNQIPYDSDAATRTAVMSGEVDFGLCKIQSGIEEYKAGELKFLCVLATEPVSVMPDVPLVTAEYPDFEEYLPWGPFYGVWVKKGTDESIRTILSEAFATAADNPEYKAVLDNFYINFIGTVGDEAQQYILNWGKNTSNALQKSGILAAK